MNPLKKAYCRMFQSVLKAALPFLPYRKPEIIHSVRGIPQILEKKKCDHVVLPLHQVYFLGQLSSDVFTMV